MGEVSDALEKVFGRHRADIQKVTGVYAAAYDSAEGWDKLKGEIAAFGEAQGRRPRVMIAKLGQDGHDRGAKVVATAFAKYSDVSPGMVAWAVSSTITSTDDARFLFGQLLISSTAAKTRIDAGARKCWPLIGPMR